MMKSISLHRPASSRDSDAQDSPAAPAGVATGRPESPDAQHHPTSTSDEPPLTGMTHHGRIRFTRISAWWSGLILAAILCLALLIFIAQNSHAVSVHYLGLHGQVSLAIALLLSATAAVLVVAVPGTARIVQLRHALKKTAHDTGSPRRTP